MASNVPGCEPSDFAKSIHIVERCLESIGRTYLAMMTLKPSTEHNMPEQLTWFAVDTHANHLAQPQEGDAPQKTYGRKCSASSNKSNQDTLLPRMCRKKQSLNHLNASKVLVTRELENIYQQLLAGLTIKEIVGGFVHTPTTKANFTAPSMQKWKCCRNYVTAFGAQAITPEQFEFLMGYPIGWTDLQPSEIPLSPKSPNSSDEQLCGIAKTNSTEHQQKAREAHK